MKNCRYMFNCLFFLLHITTSVVYAEIPTDNPETAVPAEETVSTEAISTETAVPTEAAAETISTPDVAVLIDKEVSIDMPASAEIIYELDPYLFQQAVDHILPKDGRLISRLDSGETIYRKELIQKMYEENDKRPLWNPISIQSLSDSLSVLAEDGLDPAEYQFEAIRPYLKDPSYTAQSPEEAAKIDILLTEAYLRAMYNMDYGKVDPERLDADNNYSSIRDKKDRTSQYLSWVQEGRIDEAFNWVRPKIESYKLLKSALARYQKIKADGGWPIIPNGRVIKLGKSDSRISLVRSRLTATGDITSAIGPDTVDEWLEDGIRKFQERYNLKADGVIGPSTLAVMNVPVEKRIDQIRANLDRQRWYFPKDVEEYLMIDVAGYHLYWMKNHEVFWKSQVQVGKRTTSTPIFRDQIEHIDFNPTWSVPPGIKKRQILPSLKIDSSYLDKKGYQLLDDYGNKIDPHDIDWDDVKEMPYIVRQPPGWSNALGKVKFMFPNKHSVFLHDTNHRDYFARQTRTTSSGCIRLNNPFEFAELLLERQDGWNRERIDQLLATNRTTRVNLDKPLPILIQYSTVSATEYEVKFRADIYNRDNKLLAALNKSFELHLPDLPENTQARIRAGVQSASASVARLLGPDPEIIGDPYENRYRDESQGGNSMFEL